MKVRELIGKLKKDMVEKRRENLVRIEAPSIIIEKTKIALEQISNNTFKVNGLQKKYKALENETVINFIIYKTKTITFRSGKKDTVAIKIELAQGTYYYDWYTNKFGELIEMSFTK